MEDLVSQNFHNLNFVEIVCIYLLFDVKKSLNKLSSAIDNLSAKVNKIDRLELKIEALEKELHKLL